MKIYLAASFAKIKDMVSIAEILITKGHKITSRWIYGGHDIADSPFDKERFAREDIEDLKNSELCLSFTGTSLGRGGRHVEFGMAIASGIKCIIIGPRENVFHHLSDVKAFPNFESFLNFEPELSKERK